MRNAAQEKQLERERFEAAVEIAAAREIVSAPLFDTGLPVAELLPEIPVVHRLAAEYHIE